MTTTNDISLERVMDTMAEGLFVLDAACCITLWNVAMRKMTGWRAGEMIGKPCSDLICSPAAGTDASGMKPDLDCALLQHVDGKLAVSQVECMVQTSTDETIPVLKNARVLLDDNETATGVVVTLTDLRPMRRLEQDLAVMRHEAMPVRGLGRLVGGSNPMQNVYARIAPAGDSEVTVLIEGDDIHDPVGDAMRSILDGHIMLSRDLARQHHYPAVDVLGSVSRLRNDIVTSDDIAAGANLMRWLKSLEDNRDLVNIGAYVAGSDPVLDEALAHEGEVREFLTQGVTEGTNLTDTLGRLRELTGVA